jgi:hypothetical protein
MRRFFSAVGVAALMCSAVLASAANAGPNPSPSPRANGAVADCAIDVLPNIPQANLGECVSYSIIPNHAFSTHDCDAFLEIEPEAFYLVFDSYSQCVRELRNSY